MTRATSYALLTFLFTDIEGSTRRWEADADAMRSALERHDEALRVAVTDCGGVVFKHTGDGICAAFSSPGAAVDAAISAQRSLELPVRMGIATGEAEQRDGDYFGAVLNRAARVMAAGHGGQILLDGATAGLLNDVDLTALGRRRLRDIAKPVELFQAAAAGLQAEFPPLRTVDRSPGNLPIVTSPLIGRTGELLALDTQLKTHRLVTLTGVGGVGKTRLALEVGASLADEFPDGVWLIELATVGDPAAVPEATAAALGISQQPGQSLTQSISAALDGRSRLLIFDNCEHVLDAAADLIAEILAHAATVRVLATSREGLGLSGEQLWPVPSLDVRLGVASSAATLFIERARAVAPTFSLSGDDDATAVVEICHRLDGIPLAIELAASRIQSMTVTEVRDRIGDRFRLLVGGRRGVERHQTLRHTVQWSYDLLDEDEKVLLSRVSVFAGGFDLPAATAVAGTGDDLPTADLLHALVRKSLILADRTAAVTRFSTLETVRQFAEERLAAYGELDEARTAHARYFAARESDVLALWDSPLQRESYSWLTVELPNLRTAFKWAAAHDDLDTAASIAVYSATLGYWLLQYEPATWAEEVSAAAERTGHPRLAQLYIAAAQCYMTGRVDAFLRYANAGQTAVRSRRFADVPVELEGTLAGGYLTCVDAQRCLAWVDDAVERAGIRSPYIAAARVFALMYAGVPDEAMAAADDLMAATEFESNPTVVRSALHAWGSSHRGSQPEAAYRAVKRGLDVARGDGDRQLELVLGTQLASMAVNQADPIEALDYTAESIRSYFDSGSLSFVSGPLGILTGLLDRLGRFEAAATISGFADAQISRATYPEIGAALAHLREVLGDAGYESLARTGAAMTNAVRAAYALEQIDLARTGLT
ncbi:adenylate/guanylate cyclase domain-containing protein [Mycolicibacterium sp. CR10]|uniref:ATP-binding protein n=1 Tax=Mycolicibacterium sp. CR10 TaxID=2562314 RepID=UPI0010C117CC|nr:adenylate/guanylate cyclase domain-containing protein [Mycolicibacterium sp. CR10]